MMLDIDRSEFSDVQRVFVLVIPSQRAWIMPVFMVVVLYFVWSGVLTVMLPWVFQRQVTLRLPGCAAVATLLVPATIRFVRVMMGDKAATISADRAQDKAAVFASTKMKKRAASKETPKGK